MFADTRNDRDDSDSHDDSGTAKFKASLTIGARSAADGASPSEAKSEFISSFGAKNGNHQRLQQIILKVR